MGRPREHGEDVRDRLLAAAGRLLAAEGPGAVSVRRLADEVGTTTRAIYSVFGGKEGLFAAMYRRMADALVRSHEAIGEAADPADELLPLAQAYRASARAHPTLYPLLFAGTVPGFAPPEADVAYAKRGLARVIRAMERGVAEGRLRRAEPVALARQLWGLVHGLASLELAGLLGSRAEADAVWRGGVSTFVAGLRQPAPAARPRARRAGA